VELESISVSNADCFLLIVNQTSSFVNEENVAIAKPRIGREPWMVFRKSFPSDSKEYENMNDGFEYLRVILE